MDKKERKSTVGRTLYYYWQELRKHKVATFFSCFLVIVIEVIQSIWYAYAISQLLEIVSSGQVEARMEEVVFYTVSTLVSYFLSQIVLRRLQVWILWKLELQVNYELAKQAFEKLSMQSMNFHSNKFSGSLVSQTSKYIGAFEELFDTINYSVLPFLTVTTFSVILLWQIMPVVGIVALVAVMLFTVAAVVFVKIGEPIKEAEVKAETRQTGQLADSISNILAVKSYGREGHEQKRFANVSRAVFAAGYRNMRFHTIRDLVFSVVFLMTNTLVILFVAFGNLWFGLGVGALVMIYSYCTQLTGYLWELTHMMKSINRVFSNSHEMVEILDTPDEVVDVRGAKDLVVARGAVEFRGISFRHKDAKENLFEDFSLMVKGGERVGLVGISGSGKTTLTKLLLRFDDVDEGEILVDGQNIAEVRQVSLRENIAYVPQETALFHRTIKENIAYGRSDASDAEILRASRQANAAEFIEDMAEKYETLVGERGVKLSGGQRQRVAIARAMLKDAPILVLDEATSALDSESEALIQEALGELMEGRTSIVIAHRLSTVAALDRIIVLKDGKIVEQGSHKELLGKGGEYSKLWDRQTGGFLEEE